MEPPQYFDQALVRDLESRFRVSNLLDWLEQEAETIADLAYAVGSGVDPFRQSLHRVRNIAEIRPGRPGSLIGEHAHIVPEGRQYVVHYRMNLSTNKRRFSVAHEIGHTYFFDPNDPGKPISPFQSSVSGLATIERLCDFFAESVLLPRRHVVSAVVKDGAVALPPLHLIKSLAQEYRVDDKVVARRLLFRLFPRNVAILMLRRRMTIPKGKGGRGEWMVSWCAAPWELREAHSVKGIRVPFLSEARTIPSDMIPMLSSGVTEHCELDGRWWDGVRAQSTRESGTAFKHRLPKRAQSAFACRLRLPLFEHVERLGRMDLESKPEGGPDEVIYIALLLHATQSDVVQQ